MKRILQIKTLNKIQELPQEYFVKNLGYEFERIPLSRGKVRWGEYTKAFLTKIAKKNSVVAKIVKRSSGVKDIAMWIGSNGYPTIKDFVKEAAKMGASKRVNKLPDDIIPGKSKVWLIHDEGEGENRLKETKGKIFGFFILRHIEVIFKDKKQREAFYEKLKRDDIKIFELWQNSLKEKIRGCGYRYPGGFYLVNDLTDEALQIAEKYKASFHLDGTLVKLNAPMNYSGRRFRGFKYADDIKELLIYKAIKMLEK